MTAGHLKSRTGRRNSGVERDIAVTAADGTTLLVDHLLPKTQPHASAGRAVVWIRTPYGRKGMHGIAKKLSTRGAHVLVEALRGTDGSGGTFDGSTLSPSDGADVADWLRRQSWFPGTIVTWGISAIGYASWALAARDIPEWRLAILQDAPSEIRDAIVYRGGVFAGAVTLGFVENIDWLSRHPGASLPCFMLASVRGARRTKKTLAQLPLGTADERLLGHRVEYFQQWLAREHDDDYWERLNLRRHVDRMPEQVHLATGWHDIYLASTLADYAASARGRQDAAAGHRALVPLPRIHRQDLHRRDRPLHRRRPPRRARRHRNLRAGACRRRRRMARVA